MKYVCLVYADEKELARVDDADCMDCNAELERQGKRVAAEALHPVRTATTVRVREGVVSLTDGPFAETREQLAGFYLIDATDLEDALRIAAKIPAVAVGSVEVRPVRELRPDQVIATPAQ